MGANRTDGQDALYRQCHTAYDTPMRKRKKIKGNGGKWATEFHRKPSKRMGKSAWYDMRARELRVMPSPAEAALWDFLKTQRTGHLFHWNYAYPPYIIDFVCFNSALIVEIDGEFHSGQTLADEERDRFFSRKGAKTMRFMAKDVAADPQATARIIAKACAERHGIPSAL
jgi:very-short-patch-repair endonuclease